MNRLHKLRQSLAQKELDALIVSHAENRRYISGFTGSTGWLLVSNSNACLAVDFRYLEQAKREAPDFEIIHVKGNMSNWLPKLASDFGFKRVGFEAEQVPFALYQQLCERIADSRCQLQLIPTTGLVSSLRVVKEPEELKFITRAVELADAAFAFVRTVIRSGVTEREIAWEVEKLLREKGSEPLPFNIIVASGPNSALPHAKPSERVVSEGEPILIDIGARANGYCSDLSRTFFLGENDKTFCKIYDIVLGAQLTALATIVGGMSGTQADRLARTVVEQSGYGDAFGHGLGHGVGLEAHESPLLSPDSSDMLVDDMVFTIEPGIYIDGWGGVRIEDTVVIKDGRVKSLTKADKTANIS